MVGNNRRRCSARICFLVDEITCAEGGASAGTGVDRPLRAISTETELHCSCKRTLFERLHLPTQDHLCPGAQASNYPH